MRSIFAMTVGAAIFGAAVPAHTQNYDTPSYCKNLGSGSYSLEAACRRMENEAREKAKQQYVAPDIRSHCASLMNSYNLFEACVRNEEHAQRELYGPGTRTDVTASGGTTGGAAPAKQYHDPGAVSLCSPPNRMTDDGCQPPKRR